MVNKKIDDNIYFGDFPKHGGGGSGGGEMLEVRVAKLESNVEDIKANLSEARVDIRDLRNTSSGTSRDVAVILQKQLDIDENYQKTQYQRYGQSHINCRKQANNLDGFCHGRNCGPINGCS